MKILITNHALTTAGGTEQFVVELAQALRRRGHEIMIFSPRAGNVASVLSNEKFPIFSDPATISTRPDVIHGQHHMETMLALLNLPGVPCAYFCHGMIAWQECPPVHPRVLRYVFLSDLTARYLVLDRDLPEERFHIIPNHIDLTRFKGREPREHISKAAICSRMPPQPELVAGLNSMLEKRGIALDVIWDWARGTLASAEDVYASYDLIFGTGRTAIEAMAAGCLVSTTSHDKIGPIITPDNFHDRRRFNFALASWERSLAPDDLGVQLDGFSPAEHERLLGMVSAECDIDREAAMVEGVYEEVVKEWQTASKDVDEMPALRHYLWSLAPLYDIYDDENRRAREENAWLRGQMQTLERRLGEEEKARQIVIKQRDELQNGETMLVHNLASAREQLAACKARLQLVRGVLNKSLTGKFFLRSLRKALNQATGKKQPRGRT